MTQTPIVLAFAGRKRTGKDTAAQVLADIGYAPVAFATPLKALAAHLFGFDFYDEAAKNVAVEWPRRAPADDVVRDWGIDNTTLGMVRDLFPDADHFHVACATLRPNLEVLYDLASARELTPRRVLQRLGTEWGRGVRDDVWVEHLRRRVMAQQRATGQRHFAITDCRFPNEAEFVRAAMRGLVAWIDAEARVPPDGDTHASEPTRAQIPHDVVVDNNGTPREFALQVNVVASFASNRQENDHP